jgi:parvulin-like peptidyl-prolyl isomerase
MKPSKSIRCLRTCLAGAVVWGMLVGAATRANPAASAAQQANRPAATVNGEVITFGQLEPVLKLSGPVPAELPEAQRRELQREALASLIDDLLLQQFLRKYVPPTDPGEINKKMAELASELKEKNQSLADFCRDTHQTEAQIRTNLAHSLQWAAYTNKHVSDAELQRYYNEFRDFFDRIVVRASHIVLRVGPNAPESEKTAARAKLLDLRNQIVSGKLDFAAAARAHSQCPTAPSGGDIGSFPRKFIVDENFARAAFALKPGEISGVVQTDFGLHLIKVTERTPGQPSDFNKIKADVKEFYMDELRLNVLTRLRKEARIEIHLP